jgi:class 3 adenylate cyclase
MESPRTQFATTADGIAIAYAVSGQGPYLVAVPSPPDNHIELEWADDRRRPTLEDMGRYRTVVRFDSRGTGASDREADDFSLEARLRDMEAVLGDLGNPPVALLTGGHGAQLAVAYAAAHSDLVTHLIVVNPFARGEEFMERKRLEMWRQMLHTDYSMFTGALGAEMFGWGQGEGLRFSDYFQRCVTADTALRIYEAMIEVDLSEVLPAISAPSLVIRTQNAGFASPAIVRAFAARLPNVRLETVPGLGMEGTTEPTARLAMEFLGEPWVEPPRSDLSPSPPPFHHHQGLRTLLFTDLEGHTAMMSQLGDERGRTVLREHERITREALAKHEGREVKTMGDGFMASFMSAQKALECAVTLQRTCAMLGDRGGDTTGLRLRVGINAGEPIEEDDDFFGHAVIAAARIAAQAEGSEVLVSDVVRQLVAGKGFLFSDRGHVALKGLEEPIRVWELNWR